MSGRNESRHQPITSQRTEIHQGIKFLECEIGSQKIIAFNNSAEEWTGAIEDRSLFEVWRNIQQKIVQNTGHVDNFANTVEMDDNFEENLEFNESYSLGFYLAKHKHCI